MALIKIKTFFTLYFTFWQCSWSWYMHKNFINFDWYSLLFFVGFLFYFLWVSAKKIKFCFRHVPVIMWVVVPCLPATRPNVWRVWLTSVLLLVANTSSCRLGRWAKCCRADVGNSVFVVIPLLFLVFFSLPCRIPPITHRRRTWLMCVAMRLYSFWTHPSSPLLHIPALNFMLENILKHTKGEAFKVEALLS